MRICSQMLTLLFVIMVFLGCDKTSEAPQGNQPGPQRPLPAELSLVFDEDFASRVRIVQKDKMGNIWVGRSAEKSAGSAPSIFIEHRRQNGDLLQPPFELGEGNLAGLAALDDGSLIAALLVDGKHLEAYYALKLVAISADGNRLFSRMAGTERDDVPRALAASVSMIAVGADVYVSRPTSVRNYQSDIWLSALDGKDGRSLWSRTIDVRDEDSLNTLQFLSDKYVAIGGNTGQLQVSTGGNIVKHGDASLMLTDLSGNILGQSVFGTERNDYVSTLMEVEGSKILVGGTKNGPITHDGDNDKTQLHCFGFLDLISIEKIVHREL